MIFGIAFFFLLVVAICWSCCACAGRYDDETDELYRSLNGE
jgi:hypothetical protein